MVAKHGASMMARFFPVESYPVVAPVLFASALFTYMLGTLAADPDSRHNPNMPLDCASARAYGDVWRNRVRRVFSERIQTGAISIFDNGPMAMPIKRD